MNECLVIVPSRGRQERIKYFYNKFMENSKNSDLIIVCDDDDNEYPKFDNAEYMIVPRTTVPEKINMVAKQQAKNYKYLSFLGDDHVPMSHEWDQKLMDSIPNFGIAYGNDLHQYENLPTVCIMTSNIPMALGYMAIPFVNHFYIDNAWKEWGTRTNSLVYHNNVVIEHLHPAAGKSNSDDTYSITNEYILHDSQEFENYLANRLSVDILKLKGVIEKL